jgi:hypothetical protein
MRDGAATEVAMHDIDSVGELESQLDEFGVPQQEYGNGSPDQAEHGVFDEAQEMELAAELLDVSGEAELDQFLGGLIGQAGKVVGKALHSPIGRQLGGFLKGVAKKALPTLAGVAGTMVGGPIGGFVANKVVGKIASADGEVFGLELEGLSPEDREFETARHFIRFAGEAARHASQLNADDPHLGARRAVALAARALAPGLLRPAADEPQSEVEPPAAPLARTGRWIRQGKTIVLYGL